MRAHDFTAAGDRIGAFADVVLLGNDDVERLVSMADAVDALDWTYGELSTGRAHPLLRTQARWGASRMQALGGALEGLGCAGVKSWTVTPQGAQPTIVLFSATDGRVLAILEASHLGCLRTGATSGLAIRHMAREDASVLLVVGTGRQAWTQIAAALHVRDITQILVAGRDRDRCAAFARDVRERFAVAAAPVPSVAAGAARADVITVVTNAVEPVLLRDMVGPGTHVNAVGATGPVAAEIDPALLADADLVAADSVEQAVSDSLEVSRATAEHGFDPAGIVALERLVTGAVTSPGGLTVFESMGFGLSDVALAELAWRRAITS